MLVNLNNLAYGQNYDLFDPDIQRKLALDTAAFATWGGRVYAQLGFTEISWQKPYTIEQLADFAKYGDKDITPLIHFSRPDTTKV